MEQNEPGLTEAILPSDQPDNLLEQLAAKRKEISEIKETFIAIPGYDRKPPLLLAKYRLLDGPELRMLGDKIRRETKDESLRTQLASVDTFDLACVGIYVDNGKGPQPLTLNGEPITGFNEDLAKALQFDSDLPDPQSHRQVIFGLFCNNDIAITRHMFQLNAWSGDTSLDVSEEMYGGNS